MRNDAATYPKILLVDDDDDCLDSLRVLLEDRGYRVHVAHNGRQALDYFHQGGRPGVIILDLLMPVMDGMEFLAHRKTDPLLAQTPVIVVTATEGRLESRDDVVFRKPVDFNALMARIETLFGRPASGAEA
jgi:CheY-like chemotaxis protein